MRLRIMQSVVAVLVTVVVCWSLLVLFMMEVLWICRQRGSKVKGCRLDRFLVSTDWLDRFEGLEQRNLLRNVSDHDPVRLSCGVVHWGPWPFRFLNAWLERKGHIKVMGDEWRRISDSHKTFSVVDRLRELKVFLKQWNRESFGYVETQIETTTALLNDLDDRVTELDDENICLRCKVQGDLWRLLRYWESIWRQKSRVLWLREGDRNTSFFQRVVKIPGMQNKLWGLVIDDRWVTRPLEIRRYVSATFQSNFSQRRVTDTFEPLVLHGSISEVDRDRLELPFSVTEVWDVIRNSEGSKAPGPDGYNMEFFKAGWSFLRDDFMVIFDEFYRTGALPRGMNSSIVVLLPKIDSPRVISDFRPICLLNSLYKIVAKVLAAHLQSVLGKQVAVLFYLIDKYDKFLI
ncbi:hypothetical protein GQ457_07G007660 [Hibiscus cannabinus]